MATKPVLRTLHEHLLVWDAKQQNPTAHDSELADIAGLSVNEVVDGETIAELRAGDLSFGQQKKLALLRVFLNSSNLLILDEPFVGLDDDTHEQLTQFLSNELIEGKGLIFTSHIPCQIKSDLLELNN